MKILALLLLLVGNAWGQTYTVVSASSGGDVGDLIIRTALSQVKHTPEYAPGGAGVIAPNRFAAKPAGDYLLFSGLMTQQVLLPVQRPDLVKYTDADFTPITQLATSFFVLFSGREFSLAQYLHADRPSVAVPGSNAVFIINALSHRAKRDVNVVPYVQISRATLDAVAGYVNFALAPASAAYPLIVEGRGHAVAITAAARSNRLPNTPTLAEHFPGLAIPSSWGLYGQRGMDVSTVQALTRQIATALASPEATKVYDTSFLQRPDSLGPQGLRAVVAAQRAQLAVANKEK